MLHNVIAVPLPSSMSSRSRRLPLWWASRAGGALVFSAFAHALAAVAVGVVLRSIPREPAVETEAVDVDVNVDVGALVNPPRDDPPSMTEVSRRTDNGPVPRQGVPMRRTKATRAHDTGGVIAPPNLSAPAETDAPTLFALSAGTVASRGGAASATASGSPGNQPDGALNVFAERDVNVPARLLSASPLVYPTAARNAEIESDLPVEILVEADGRVAAARAISRVGYGLEEAALRAIREYRFAPAQRAGRPVRVRMQWTMQFRLR